MNWRILVKIAGFLAGIRKNTSQMKAYRVTSITVCSVDAVLSDRWLQILRRNIMLSF